MVLGRAFVTFKPIIDLQSGVASPQPPPPVVDNSRPVWAEPRGWWSSGGAPSRAGVSCLLLFSA
jgi:hypothetical protein